MANINTKIEEPKINTISQQQLNRAATMMVNNDKKLLPNTGYSPKIWECTWYNSPVNSYTTGTYGYSKGDAVWINTEDLDEFVKHNAEHIREVIAGNSKLKTGFDSISGNEKSEMEFLKKVVDGSIVGSSTNQPLYYLGSITEPVKIKVSVVDNNIDLPTNPDSWKDFFNNQDPVQFSEKLNAEFERLLSAYMDQHMLEYHLSGLAQYQNAVYGQTRQLEDLYLKKNLDNVSLFQEFGNTPGEDNCGFDYVVHFCKKPFNSENGTVKTSKWFRVWQSGYLEHGGIVFNNPKHAALMGDSFECDSKLYKVNLTWAIDKVKTAPSFKYSAAPTGFYFEDNKISLSGTQYGLNMLGRHISEQDRYQIQITPILGNSSGAVPYSTMHVDTTTQNVYYVSKDAVNIENSSFCFVLDPDIQQYSYYAAGFVSNIQQGYVK